MDTTGFAVQALVGAKGADDPAVVKALGLLKSKQAASGGFIGATDELSSNSTAVAAQAFATVGDEVALAKAQSFIATLQYGCSFPAALRGGIATTPSEFAKRKAAGAKATIDNTDLHATTQATLALAGESLLTVAATDGFGDTAPMDCTPTTSTSSTTSHAGASGSTTPPVATTGPGSLAFTGSEVWPLALIALSLVLVGAGALVGSRRRGGAHA